MSRNLYGTAGRSLLTNGAGLPRLRAEGIPSRGAGKTRPAASKRAGCGQDVVAGATRGLLAGATRGLPAARAPVAAGPELLSVVMKRDGRRQRREPAQLPLPSGLRCLRSRQQGCLALPQVPNPPGVVSSSQRKLFVYFIMFYFSTNRSLLWKWSPKSQGALRVVCLGAAAGSS